tara:strand:- start:124132 stop:124347 length:216 start_codon:yes stop_codon:yes gene_type:complete
VAIRKRRRKYRFGSFERLEDRRVLAAFTVVNTDDAGAGSLRQASLDANGDGAVDFTDFANEFLANFATTRD